MSTATRTISILDGIGLRRSATLLRALHREGTYSPDGTRHKRLNVSRGLVRICTDPNTRYEVATSVRNTNRYLKLHPEPYSQNGGAPHVVHLAKVISSGPLTGQKVRIFDAGCNQGYLVDHIEQPLQRYIGMDLLEETIEMARSEAKERFHGKGCTNYEFVHGDMLDPESYKQIPKDNNVVVCTGVLGHFRPRYIPTLLNNLNQVLSDKEDARIYLGCPIFVRRICREILSDDGMSFVKTGFERYDDEIKELLVRVHEWQDPRIRMTDTHGILYRSFDPSQMIDFISHLGYEIDFENSDLIQLTSKEYEKPLRGVHFCLKRKI